VQRYHEYLKLVPLDISKAGNEVNETQPRHASLKFISSSASVLNVQAPKEVNAEQPRQVYIRSVIPERSSAGKEVSEVQASNVSLMPVTPVQSSASSFGVTISVL